MRLTNKEIIALEATKKGFDYTGNNLHTFVEWKDQGYTVIRGQRAYIKTRLWTQGINKRLIPNQLFRVDQVTKVNKINHSSLVMV